MALIQRGKTYYFVKRVPKRFTAYDTRGLVKISFKTDSESEARRKVPEVEDNLLNYWTALSEGSDDAEKFDATVRLAAARGVRYRPEKALLGRGLEEVLRRIEALEPSEAKDVAISGAVLGAVDRPAIKLSQMNDLYFDFEKTKLVGKRADQIRRWRNQRLKAFKNLVSVLGRYVSVHVTLGFPYVFQR